MASIAELRDAGTTFETDESVAIAQQLINTLRARHDDEDDDENEGQPPYGPLSADNVFLNEDGSVSCRCKTAPAVSEVGIFLHGLLPSGSPRVPGALRHTIACALLHIDVPPFDSLNEFSRDLVRHEHGVRADVVRGVLARSGGDRAVAPLSLVDRRRDAVPLNPAPPRRRTMTAAAACLAAGLALIATREYMHHRPAPIVPTQIVSVAAETVPVAMQIVPVAVETTTTKEPRAVPVHVALSARRTPSSPARGPRQDARRITMKRATLPAGVIFVRSEPESRVPSRGVIDRLRLGWLRHAFTVRSGDL